MPYGSFVKSFLTTSVTVASGASAVGTSAMNVPLMSAGIMPRGRAAGIQIWSIELEIDLTGFQGLLGTNSKAIAIMLSQVPVTAEKFANDRDVLFKTKILHVWGTTVSWNNEELVKNHDFYPAIPFYGQQLHLGVFTPTALGVSVTVYCKVWYSLVTLSQNEVLAQLQNQLT